MRKYILALALFLISTISFSQFVSGNVFVSSTLCQYNITGQWSDSTLNIAGNLQFVYDSAIVAWKFIVPDTASQIEICVSPVDSCPCSTYCMTQPISNLSFNFQFCNITKTNTLENEIRIYPNPVTNYLLIDGILKIDEIYLLSLSGMVTKLDRSLKRHNIDLDSGIYFLVINSQNSTIRKKIIIE